MNWFGRRNGKQCHKRTKRYVLCIIAAIMASVYLGLCASMRLTVRSTSFAQEDCMLYYIVNANGMKGLGHSIVLLVDEEGCGTVFSFNGMQRTLGESLLGKSGIGKMSVGRLAKEELNTFLQTGDLKLDEDQLSDNYDMALYRPITREEYRSVLEQLTPYITAEEQFAALYEQWAMEEDADTKAEYKRELEQLGQNENLPLYRIYTNNCDHVARMLASSVDPALQAYGQHAWRITPNGNFKAFGKGAENWGVIALGEQSLTERLLMFLVIF